VARSGLVIGTPRDRVVRRHRVPGNDRPWLAPSLAERVDLEAFERVADITRHDQLVVIMLRDAARWSDLEHALAPILPSEDQALKFRRQWYRRKA
jgi:hypothetical protein